jgi:hypothetical protein
MSAVAVFWLVWIAECFKAVGSIPRRVGYELSKVKFEGQTCPSHLIMDVSSPDEP